MILLIATGALLVSGCGSFGKLMDRRQSATNQQLSVDPSTLSIYLADVDALLDPDTGAGERVWQELKLDHERDPTTTNQLRYALALATPGHARTDLAGADAILTALLQKPELLLADERLLASVHLGLLRARVSAESSARQASNSASRNNARELAAARAQLSVLQRDNERLRTALEDTQQKLRAITTIERSIREREDESSGGRSQTAGGTANE